MGNSSPDNTLDRHLATRLATLRAERGWSLEALAEKSGVSRATLSRLENGETSPTASVLGKLCAAFGITMSRLLREVEEGFVPLVRREAQVIWRDPAIGFTRRSLSPPARPLAGEALECTLEAGTVIAYDAPPRPGLEHHLVMLEGRLAITLDGTRHNLMPGDCLRYQLFGASRFETPADSAARYILFMV
jgi:transcriptional regulator with XRE-family HTH domain